MTSIFSFQEILSRLQNLDLVAVGVSVASIGIMGFVVYFSDRKSETNKAFLLFSLMTIVYGIVNYFSYRFSTPEQTLWMIRLTILSATFHAFSFFNLFYVFPNKNIKYPSWYKFGAAPWAILIASLTLTPLMFPSLEVVGVAGEVSRAQPGPGILFFGLTAAIFVLMGIYWLIRKASGEPSEQRSQSRIVLSGAILTFSLILVFNLILPMAFGILDFIPLAPIFFLPFIIGTSHAIRKYHFLKVKIITTEILTFLLTVVTLIEVVIADDIVTLLLRLSVFTLVLIFGILLIRSVIKEVEQREYLEDMTKKLTNANAKLEQLDKVRSEFLSFASHQVKSPMSVVKGYAQLISDGTLGNVPDKVTETADKIKDSANRLIALVNNLLNFRQIEEGRMEFTLEELDISKMVIGVVNNMLPLAKKKSIELTSQVPYDSVLVQVDDQKFRQVIQNLIDNSIKYTDSGWIKVAVNKNKNSVIITVSDSGRGMPSDLIPELFEQFAREKNVDKRIEGTGLGLYIAKQIVLGHKGTIRASSDGPEKGSTFTITLPAS